MSEKTTAADLATIIATGNYILGSCNGFENAAYLMRQRSGMRFQKGDDKLAHVYRDLAEEFDKIAKAKEDMYRKEHKDACDGAFDVLEERFGDIDLGKETKKEA